MVEGRERGIKIGLLRLVTIWPFPDEAVEQVASHVDKILVPEMNYGQLCPGSREKRRPRKGNVASETGRRSPHTGRDPCTSSQLDDRRMHEMSEIEHPLDDYTRAGMIPHIWCTGCGNGIILGEFTRALDELKYDRNKIVVVSGIGCIGRISGYTNTDSFHTTHGRALAFAVGVKAARPDLKPVVISGDGDLFAIGGNHFIHAARRNVDITVICSNNFNYGMTGGQSGPTTPIGACHNNNSVRQH